MRLEHLPLVGTVVETGAADRIFDGLLLAGPLVLASIALLGRSLLTVGLATAYVVGFTGHTLSKARK